MKISLYVEVYYIENETRSHLNLYVKHIESDFRPVIGDILYSDGDEDGSRVSVVSYDYMTDEVTVLLEDAVYAKKDIKSICDWLNEIGWEVG